MYTKPLLPFALLAVSVACLYWLAPVGVVVALWLTIQERSPLSFINYLLRVAEGIARCIDILLNVIGGPLLNRFAVRQESAFYAFGRVEYMSTAFGFNQASDTLSRSGSRIAEALDSVDPGHCRKSAGLPTVPLTLSKGRVLLNQILLIALCVGLVGGTVWLVSR